MIHELDDAIKEILLEKGRLNSGEVDITFEQPTGEWAGGLNRPTISCWLYDIRENTQLRPNLQWEVVHKNGKAIRKRPPLRFDFSYLVTVWTRKIEDEHHLLWRALGALASVTTISPEDCAGAALQQQPYNIPVHVAQETIGVSALAELWGVLDNAMRAGFSFVITLAFDPDIGFASPPVLTKDLVFGQAEHPETHEFTSTKDTIQQIADTEPERQKEE